MLEGTVYQHKMAAMRDMIALDKSGVVSKSLADV